MQEPDGASAQQFKFLSYLSALVFVGYLGMALSYLFEFSSQDIAANPVMTAREFTPVLIVGMCYFVYVFTCGEYFGYLRYQFFVPPDAPGLVGIPLIATRALTLFFMIGIFYYFLRAGFREALWERIFFCAAPFLMGLYLIALLKRLFRDHRLPLWYYRLKYGVLACAMVGQWVANMVLFFPEFVAKIPIPLFKMID